MDFHVIIPARFHSTRLPGKVLLDIGGKPMLQHVYERAKESGATSITIATDHTDVQGVAHAWGADVCMTHSTHATGTDRLAEVVSLRHLKANAVIVGLQADEPFIPPSVIRQVAENLSNNASAKVATLFARLTEVEQIFDSHIVKVVTDQKGYALYFSRAPIPWDRDTFPAQNLSAATLTHYHRHIGIYAYRASFLKTYVAWDKSPLEELEKLEQLRVLWHGEKIHVAEAIELPGIGVDTAEDLACVRALFLKK